jgi:CO/xanthine dehydrogenase FAD-binding subunit
MLDLKNLYRPKSAEEAVRALLETEGTGLYVAGGTIVVPTGSPSLDYLVDLTGVGLDYVRVEDTPDGRALVIGAMTRIADLAASPELASPELRAIIEAAADMGTHTTRNRATVGGNVFAAHFPSDLPPAFLALGASVRLQGADGPRDVSLEDFYARRSKVYRRGDLIVEIRVPAGLEGLASAFEKTGRTRVDVAIASCAAAVAVDGGTIGMARVVLNGISSVPYVAAGAEAYLTGKSPTEDVFREAGRLVSASVSPRGDHRASADYRRKVAGVVTARALSRAVSAA